MVAFFSMLINPQFLYAATNSTAVECNFTKHSILLDGDVNTQFQAARRTYTAQTPVLSAFWDSNNKYHVVYACTDNNNSKKKVIIQRYNSELKLEKTITLKQELPLYGNAVCDGNYYYVLWGQNDTNKENCVVTCVAKYTLEGEKVACCELKGYESNPYVWASGETWGTCYPFDAGSAKMDIQSGILACSYAREMYSGHQSNFVFYINTNTMERVQYSAIPYCSHSFDQAVIATSDGGYLFANHGDAYSRGFQIDKVNYAGKMQGEEVTFHFREGSDRGSGYNETYAQLGGLAETSIGYVLCGSSEKTLSYDVAPTNGSYCGHGESRNLFVQVLKKDFYNYSNESMYAISGEKRIGTGKKPSSTQTQLFLEAGTEDNGVIWITDYSDEYYVCNPKVITAENKIVLIWEKRRYDDQTGSVFYEIFDENMNVLQGTTEISNTYLTGNTEPSYKNGKIYWTTSDDYGQNINILDLHYDSSSLKDETATVDSYSVSLEGNIVLNCYVNVSDKLANDSAAYIEFTNGEKKQQIALSSAEKKGNGKYKVTYELAASEMGDPIAVQLICRNYKYSKSQISVRKYAEYIIQHQNDKAEYKKAVPLIKAMLNYGGYAQVYFGYHTSNLANKDIYSTLTDPVRNQKVSQPQNSVYNYVDIANEFYGSSEENSLLEYYGASLVCNSNTKLKLYFKAKTQDLSYDKLNNLSYSYYGSYNSSGRYQQTSNTSKFEDGMWIVSFENISAANLDNVYYVKNCLYKDNNDAILVPYSPMTYILKGAESENVNFANLCKAMYFYNQAAKEYQN